MPWFRIGDEATATDLRAILSGESRCVSVQRAWPNQRCELIAGHEGLHQARGHRPGEFFTWAPGGR